MITLYPDIPCKRIDPDAPLPTYGMAGNAGMDLRSMEDVTLAPGETRTVSSGVAFAIPKEFVGLVFPRSGLGSKGLTLSNCVGVIDQNYRGAVGLPLHNNHQTHRMERIFDGDGELCCYSYRPNNDDPDLFIHVRKGDRVAQIVFVPVAIANLVEVSELDRTERGTSGFGSSGRL